MLKQIIKLYRQSARVKGSMSSLPVRGAFISKRQHHSLAGGAGEKNGRFTPYTRPKNTGNTRQSVVERLSSAVKKMVSFVYNGNSTEEPTAALSEENRNMFMTPVKVKNSEVEANEGLELKEPNIIVMTEKESAQDPQDPTDILSDLILNPEFKMSKAKAYKQIALFFQAKGTEKLTDYEFDQVSSILKRMSEPVVANQQPTHFVYPVPPAGSLSTQVSSRASFLGPSSFADSIQIPVVFPQSSPSRVFSARFEYDENVEEKSAKREKILVPVPVEPTLNVKELPLLPVRKASFSVEKTIHVEEVKSVEPTEKKTQEPVEFKSIESFQFTIPSLEPVKAVQPTLPTNTKFDFGPPKIETLPVEKSSGYSFGAKQNDATSGFSFTAKPKEEDVSGVPIAKSSEGTSTFGFTFKPAPAEDTKEDTKVKPSSSFGSSTDANKAFSFGTASEPAKTASIEPAKGFSFGTSSEPVKAFSFGASAEASRPPSSGESSEPAKFQFVASAEPAKAFSFGGSSEPAKAFSFGESSGTKKDNLDSGFSFGVTKKDEGPLTAIAEEKPIEAKPTFSFLPVEPSKPEATKQTNDDKQESKPFSFGFGATSAQTTESTTKPAFTGFSFLPKDEKKEGSTEGEKVSTNEQRPAFGFTAPADTNKPFAFGQAKPFSFGPTSEEKKEEPSKPPVLFSFGADPQKPAAAFTFGASETKTVGISESQETEPSASKKRTLSFTPEPSDNSKKTGGFSFGSVDSQQPAFTFGATAESKLPAFGLGEKKPEDQSGIFSFGSSQNKQPAPFTFGAPPVAEAPVPENKPSLFTFGASSEAAKSPFPVTANSQPTFSFGSTAPSSGSQPAFSFGQQPAQPAPAPFSFSQPAPTTGFAFGSAPAFGSQQQQPFVFGQQSSDSQQPMAFNMGSSSPSIAARPKSTPMTRRRPK